MVNRFQGLLVAFPARHQSVDEECGCEDCLHVGLTNLIIDMFARHYAQRFGCGAVLVYSQVVIQISADCSG
jgi:hypothetical protein